MVYLSPFNQNSMPEMRPMPLHCTPSAKMLSTPTVTGDANHTVRRLRHQSIYELGGAAPKVVAVPFVMTVPVSFENMLIIQRPRPALSKQWWYRTLGLRLLLKGLAKRTITNTLFIRSKRSNGRSQWPCGLRRRSSAARLLRSWVRIPPRAWMFVFWVLCVVR